MEFDQMFKLTKAFNNLYLDALETACKLNMLKSKEPSIIPELNIEASNVCSEIYKAIIDYFRNDDEETSVEIIHKTVGRFCLCAGMGAVAQWHINYKGLKENGIYETLIKERGIYEMDEYVYDLVGINMGSKECKDFISKSFLLFDLVLKKAFDMISDLFPDGESNFRKYLPFTIMEVNKVMYKVGITIEAQILLR